MGMTQRHVKMTQKPQLKNINPTHYLQWKHSHEISNEANVN